MSKWEIEYYEDKKGGRPVENFINRLPLKKKANVIHVLDLVTRYGIHLGHPYVKHIDGKIWELRPGDSRILYFVHTGKKFVLLHGFKKKTRKTPKKELKIAIRRKKDYDKKN